MSNNVIRFDNYHPDFQGPRVMQPGIQFEVYSHGIYLGHISLLPKIEAFGRHHDPVGHCQNVDQAIDLLIADATDQQVITA